MSDNLSVVVLAAGSSTRYGMLKQTELFGNERLTIAEHNLLDAISYGVNEVVFVIKEQIADIFHKRLSMVLPSSCRFSLTYQSTEPKLTKFCNRIKPWGTAHAVLSAKHSVHGNFAVMNADDLYGKNAIETLITFLKNADTTQNDFCCVGYRLDDTLSENGTVSRGVITEHEDRLQHITEHCGVQKVDNIIIDEHRNVLPGDSLVSMNLWGFTPKIFPILESGWQKFKETLNDPVSDEFYLPHAVNDAIFSKNCTVRVVQTTSKWHGITYPGDRKILENWLKK